MLTSLETRLPFLSFLLLLALLTATLLIPSKASSLAMTVFILGLAMNVYFIMRRNRVAFAKAEITREKMYGNIAFEIFGLVLVIFLAVVGSYYLATYAGTFVESRWQGFGVIAGFIAAILVSFAVGLTVRWGIAKVKWHSRSLP